MYLVTRCVFGIFRWISKKLVVIRWYWYSSIRKIYLWNLTGVLRPQNWIIDLVTRWLSVGYSRLLVKKLAHSYLTLWSSTGKSWIIKASIFFANNISNHKYNLSYKIRIYLYMCSLCFLCVAPVVSSRWLAIMSTVEQLIRGSDVIFVQWIIFYHEIIY